MQKYFEKIKERLEENQEITFYFDGRPPKQVISYDDVIEIVNQVAEEYVTDTNVGNKDGWIPCSGCSECKHKECEHYGKV